MVVVEKNMIDFIPAASTAVWKPQFRNAEIVIPSIVFVRSKSFPIVLRCTKRSLSGIEGLINHRIVVEMERLNLLRGDIMSEFTIVPKQILQRFCVVDASLDQCAHNGKVRSSYGQILRKAANLTYLDM